LALSVVANWRLEKVIANSHQISKGVAAGPDYIGNALFCNLALAGETLDGAGGVFIDRKFRSRIEMLEAAARQTCWLAKGARHGRLRVGPNLAWMARDASFVGWEDSDGEEIGQED
jgi:hypothetical protein